MNTIASSNFIMVLHVLCSVSVLFYLFLAIFITLNPSGSKKSAKSLPPGPRKLPLIGNIHQFASSLPHQTLRNLANQYGPLMRLQLGEKLHIIVSSAEMAKEIMKTHDAIFANRPYTLASKLFFSNNTSIVFSPSGSYWRQQKMLCISKLLNQKRLQSFRFIREEEVSKLIRNIYANEGSVINLSVQIVFMTNDIIARALLGDGKYRDQVGFLSVLGPMSKFLAGLSIVDFYPSIKVLTLLTGMKAKLERVQKENDRALENIITDREAKKRSENELEEDLLEALLKTQKMDDLKTPITRNNIKATLWDMLAGGTGAPSITIIWAMSELMKNPKAMEKAQTEVRRFFDAKGYVDETNLHELRYLNSVIKETLRLHPPELLSVPRENNKACMINGYEIPAKSRIIVNAWAIGRDPKYWVEAERFEPERFLDNPVDFKGTNFEYIPFGAGRRICPAIAFAMPYIELALASLVYHFDWKLPNGIASEDLDMTESFGLLSTRMNDLCLIPNARCLPEQSN